MIRSNKLGFMEINPKRIGLQGQRQKKELMQNEKKVLKRDKIRIGKFGMK